MIRMFYLHAEFAHSQSNRVQELSPINIRCIQYYVISHSDETMLSYAKQERQRIFGSMKFFYKFQKEF